MVRGALLAATVAFVSLTAQAEHAVAPEKDLKADVVPAATREICTTTIWGDDVIRTDCRESAHAAPEANPALKGICTIYYGVRTCY
jgi:hypothetical protein